MILWDEMTERQKFEAVFCAQVKRSGSAAMLRVLDEIGFFEAPASTKYHGNYKGGFVYNTDDYPYGHGEKSVYMIMDWMHLTDGEALAIRWHMGAYDAAARSDLRELSRAMEQSKLVTMLHLADMMATHLDESEEKVWMV